MSSQPNNSYEQGLTFITNDDEVVFLHELSCESCMRGHLANGLCLCDCMACELDNDCRDCDVHDFTSLERTGLVAGAMRRQARPILSEVVEVEAEADPESFNAYIDEVKVEVCQACLNDRERYGDCGCNCFSCMFEDNCDFCLWHSYNLTLRHFPTRPNPLFAVRTLAADREMAARLHNKLMHALNGNTSDERRQRVMAVDQEVADWVAVITGRDLCTDCNNSPCTCERNKRRKLKVKGTRGTKSDSLIRASLDAEVEAELEEKDIVYEHNKEACSYFKDKTHRDGVLVYDLWNYETGRNTREYNVKIDHEAEVRGMFNFGGHAMKIVGYLPLLNSRDKVYGSSDCGTLVWVDTDRFENNARFFEHNAVNMNPEERLFECLCDAGYLAVTKGFDYNTPAVRNQTISHYRRFFKDGVGIKKLIDDMMDDPRFHEEILRRQMIHENFRPERVENNVRAYCNARGKSYKRTYSLARYNLFYKMNKCLLFTMCYYYAVFFNLRRPDYSDDGDDVNKMFQLIFKYYLVSIRFLAVTYECLYKVPVLCTICPFITLFIELCSCGGLQIPSHFQIIHSVNDAVAIDNASSLIALPANKKFISKMSFINTGRSFKNMFQAPIGRWFKKQPSVNLNQDYVPLKWSKDVEMYGIYTPCDFLYPENDLFTLEMAVRERMTHERDIDDEIVDDYVVFGKNFIDMMPDFDLTEVEDRFVWACKQYGSKRAERMRAEFESCELDERDIWASLFVKGEVYLGKTDENFKARMIWSRTDLFLYTYGPYFHALGKLLKKYFSKYSDNYYVSGGSALDWGQFGMKINDMKHIIESDASNWDGTMGPWDLELEKYFLETKVHGMPEMKFLMNQWFKVWGKDKTSQFVVKLEYGRRSGDLWTSDFNSLLNIIKVNWSFQDTNIAVMVLGDDNVIGVNGNFDKQKIINKYRGLGMKLEIKENKNIFESSFCSGLFWNLGGQAVWGILPGRQISKWGINNHYHSDNLFIRLIAGNARSTNNIGGHVPFYWSLMDAVYLATQDVKVYRDKKDWQTCQGGHRCYPTLETYEQFGQRYGCEVEEIFELEKLIMNIELSFPLYLDHPLLRRMVEIDTGSECSTNLIGEEAQEHDVLLKDNLSELLYGRGILEEENEKVKIALEEGITPLQSAYNWGKAEVDMGANPVNIMVHVVSTFLFVYVNKNVGLFFHRCFNMMVMELNRREAIRQENMGGIFRDPLYNVLDTIMLMPATKKVIKQVIVQRKRKKNRRKNRTKAVDPYVIANVQPFSDKAIGAKIPDAFSYPTTTWKIKGISTLKGTNGAGGYPANTVGAAIYYPYARAQRLEPSSISGTGIVTWSAGTFYSMNGYSSFEEIVQNYRIVGGGIRITVPTSASNTDGTIMIAQFPHDMSENLYGATTAPTNANSMESLPTTDKYNLAELINKPLIVPFMRVDQGSYRFRYQDYPLTASPYAETASGWAYTMVYVHGASSAVPSVDVEWVVHVEYIPDAINSYFGIGGSEPCPPNKTVLDDAIRVQQVMPNSYLVEDTEHDLGDKIIEVAKKASTVISRAHNTYNKGSEVMKVLSRMGFM